MGYFILKYAGIAFTIYFYAIFFYVLSSWVPALRENPVGRFIEKIVRPYLDIFRQFIPPIGMIDVSPIAAILVYSYILQPFVLEGLAFLLSLLHVA